MKMIRLQGVWHHYGVRPILKDVSFDVDRGELVAVMGPNGMGKSTLLGLLGGVLCPLRGSIEVAGKLRRSSPDAELAIRRKLVYLPDDPYLPFLQTGREYILAMGRIYGVEEFRLMEHADRLLKLFDLSQQGDSPIRTYSTGQKKKIGLCAALITEAEVMVLDEPFSGGLDSSALVAVSEVLKHLAERDDVTVVMAVPVPELVKPLAHRVAIIADGELRAFASPETLCREAGSDDLGIVLEKMIHPEVMTNIASYLEVR